MYFLPFILYFSALETRKASAKYPMKLEIVSSVSSFLVTVLNVFASLRTLTGLPFEFHRQSPSWSKFSKVFAFFRLGYQRQAEFVFSYCLIFSLICVTAPERA